MRVASFVFASLLTCLVVVGCAQTPKFATVDSLQDDGEWLEAVVQYRKMLRANPRDTELRSRLQQAEQLAADRYLAAGQEEAARRNFAKAVYYFEHGLLANPRNLRLNEARGSALKHREAKRLYDIASRHEESGNYSYAKRLLQEAANYAPNDELISQRLRKVAQENKNEEYRYVVTALQSGQPISINFDKAKLKDAFAYISKPFGLNFIFDEGVQDMELTLVAENVTFKQALNMILGASKTFYKTIGENTLLIAPDTDEKHGEYEDYFVKVFQLKTIPAQEMAEILRTTLNLSSVVANARLNTVQIRDSRDRISLAERLVSLNDRKSAEVMFAVEILEVNRTKSEQLGLDYGSQITAGFPKFDIGSIAEKSFAQVVTGQGVVTLPSVTLKYFKQDVDAKILASPRIRALDGQQAKLHIGDRVPLRSSTIQDATGQTRTTFEYRDIGIRLNVKPKYHLDNTITVEMNLEVSSLGQNLGTSNEPAFSIGTRNVNTTMLLRENETAILGGLIRDEERKSKVKLPGIGTIPGVGNLFSVNDDQDTRTDILLTMTPTIVRTQSVAQRSETDFYAGTKRLHSTKRPFEYLEPDPDRSLAPKISLDNNSLQEASNSKSRNSRSKDRSAAGKGQNSAPSALDLSFSQALYTVREGDEIDVILTGANNVNISEAKFRVLFNPKLLQFVSATESSSAPGVVQVTETDQDGAVEVTLSDAEAAEGRSGTFASFRLRATQRGLSYLMVNTASTLVDADGRNINARFNPSKIAVQ